MQLFNETIENFFFVFSSHIFTLLIDEGIVSILDHMLSFTAIKVFNDLAPFFAFLLDKLQENKVLLTGPHTFDFVGV